MGDIADWYIERAISAHPDWSPYGGRSRSDESDAPTCNRCGFSGGYWEETDDGWRIHDLKTYVPHECNARQAENIFEDLT